MSRKFNGRKKPFDSAGDRKFKGKDRDDMTITACMNRIMLKICEDDYNEDSLTALKDELEYVGDKLGICDDEVVLLSCILEETNSFSSCSDNDIEQYLGCTNIEFLSFRQHIQSLIEKRIIRLSQNISPSYMIVKDAYDAIISDSKLTRRSLTGMSTEDIFTFFRKLFRSYRDGEIDNTMVMEDINLLLHSNPDNHFVNKVRNSGILECPETEQRIFFYLCHQYVSWNEEYIQFYNLSDFLSKNEDQQRFLRRFQSEKCQFQTRGLVSFGGSEGFMDKDSAALSDQVKKTYFTDIELFQEKTEQANKDLIHADSIKEKALFYNPGEEDQVRQLEGLLEDTYFKGVQERLDEMGMRKGFNIILYGCPGSGKTETTLQLARKTGRDVLFVDMSQLKSKWVGESEKNVKAVFDTYRDLCKKREKMPILFFNEADAIFGKRMEHVQSSAAQMLNSIQNILLQEMESIEGIMICTTNLHSNLDPAFERRFLYKINLDRPCADVRCKIWKSMMPGHTDQEYDLLGSRYALSGGQIENVVRKGTVDYVLTGNRPSFEQLSRFCDEEEFKSNIKKVGF